jgi:hypothetical protein
MEALLWIGGVAAYLAVGFVSAVMFTRYFDKAGFDIGHFFLLAWPVMWLLSGLIYLTLLADRVARR